MAMFFAVLALIKLIVWFTLLYFVASVLGEDRSHESFNKDGVNSATASNAEKNRRDEDGQQRKAEEKAVKNVIEVDGDSPAAQVCANKMELHVDGFSKESLNISKMASSHACLDDKLVEEVIIFETKGEELNANADSDGFSERHLVQNAPVDQCAEEVDIREVSTSGNSFPILLSSREVVESPDMNQAVRNKQNRHAQSNTLSHHNVQAEDKEYVFVDGRRGRSASTSPETYDFIDKHETEEVVRDRFSIDDEVGLLTSLYGSTLYGSTHEGILDEYNKQNTEENDEICRSVLHSLSTLQVLDKHQENQKVILHEKRNQPEGLFIQANRKHIAGAKNEVQDFTIYNEPLELSFHSFWEDHNEGEASLDTENHQAAGETIHGSENQENNGEVASHDSLVAERTEDKDTEINDNYTSKGGLPLVKRPKTPWWKLCGVLDVFCGCGAD